MRRICEEYYLIFCKKKQQQKVINLKFCAYYRQIKSLAGENEKNCCK